MTQRDLMELFSVSQATVSMALKNNPRISLKLRQEIQKAAREMGYCPNPAGQLLRKGKSNLIGVILPSLYYSFYAEFLEELHNYIQNCGYVLLMKNCRRTMRISLYRALQNPCIRLSFRTGSKP